MDVRAVKAAGDKAVAHCRAAATAPTSSRCRPIAIAAIRCRDPAKYRTREEVDKVRNDQRPDRAGAQAPAAARRSTEEDLKAIDAEVREIVNDAAEFAQHDPEPDPSELWTDVYR